MAKKETPPKIVLERTYNIPLRRRWLYVPKYKRAKKAITTLREFLIKHMKPGADEKGKIQLKLGGYVNEELWKHGMKNPPHHVKVVAKKDDKGAVTAELEGAPVEKPKEEPKKGLLEKIKEKKPTKTEEEEIKKEEKVKVEEKEELKAIKKEQPKAPPKQAAIPKSVEQKPTAPSNK